MRTTLTIEDDVAALPEKEMRMSGQSLKETVNRLLRLGPGAARAPQRRPFHVAPRGLGLPAGMSYDMGFEGAASFRSPGVDRTRLFRRHARANTVAIGCGVSVHYD